MSFPETNKNKVPAHVSPTLTPPAILDGHTFRHWDSPRGPPDPERFAQHGFTGGRPLPPAGHAARHVWETAVCVGAWACDTGDHCLRPRVPPQESWTGSGWTEPSTGLPQATGQSPSPQLSSAQLSSGRVDGISDEFGLGKNPDIQGGHTHADCTRTCPLKLIFEAEAV